MKLLFASDIHGSEYWCKKLEERWLAEGADKLVLLGDLLYHGPRNDLPNGYAPKAVIEILNKYSSSIIAVRGNCDAEVDQMVLEFPIMADYTVIYADGTPIFCTHGHLYDKNSPPPISEGAVLVNGHTHLYENTDTGAFRYINTGSVSLPKENRINTYVVYENGIFTIKDLDGNIIA